MSLTGKMISVSNRLTKQFRTRYYKDYPTSEFENKHLEHLVSLPNREELLRRLPKNSVVAEIGVHEGEFAEKILAMTLPEKLVLMDNWMLKSYPGLFEKVSTKFSKELATEKIKIIRELSFEGIQMVSNGYFDWVYLDTDHSYNVTRRELDLLRPKMKAGGIIAGHDYILGNWNGGMRYGVIESVREFCLKYNWELVFLTHELKIPPSFAIREIGYSK